MNLNEALNNSLDEVTSNYTIYDNPLVQDMIDMMEEFGWEVTKIDGGIIIYDGSFKVKALLSEIDK